MRLLRFVVLVGMTGMLAGGCTPDFAVRPLEPAPITARSADDGSPRTWSPETCLGVLGKTTGTPDREARRLATVRLLELYAPALLAAPQRTIEVAVGGGSSWRVTLRRGAGAGGVEPSRFVRLEPVEDFAVKNVPDFSRTPGEGAPLVGTLHPLLPVSRREPETPQPIPGITWAVTAVPTHAPGADRHRLFIDLYAPQAAGGTVRVDGATRPLAADYTTPLAVSLNHFRPQRRNLVGFLDGSRHFASAGLYPMEPPNSAKTPLVLVHGLISDPSDFYYLFNALNGDPEVRRRYQVWFFYYPTSLPVPYSATLLREDLAKFIHGLDPAGTHAALHRAVLVGHSMGGVLCRLAVSDGGDRYYGHFFRRPIGDLQLTAEQRDLLRRAFYYRASPDVSRVVFVATPHRGSRLASGPLGSVGRLLVRLPVAVSARIHGITSRNRAALAAGASLKPASSLDSLSPRDPLIAAMNEMPFRSGVRLYSVLGDRGRDGPREESSDGVVPYASSHLPQARSEVLVPAGHTGTLKRPETVAELLRILHASGTTRPMAGASL